jgi:hypothetical protein
MRAREDAPAGFRCEGLRMTAVSTRTKPVIRRTMLQGLLSCTEWASGESEQAAFGSAMHDAIAAYLLSCKAHREESRLADIDELARDAFFRKARGLDPSRLDEFKALLDRFARTHTADLHSLIHLEHTLTTDEGFAILTGTVDRLDRIDGGDPDDPPTAILIRDWKTSWAPEPHAFQLMTYSALACKTWPSVQLVATEADHFRLGSAGVIRAEYYREWLLEWWDDIIFGLRARLDGPTGTPTGGAGCQYCTKRFSCAAAIAPHNLSPENEEQAIEIFQTAIRHEAALDESKKALKAYFGDRDPAVWEGLEVGFLSPRDPSFKVGDIEAFRGAMKGLGLDPEPAIHASVEIKAVPSVVRPQLIEAGAAQMTLGDPAFKWRKAQEVVNTT